MERLGLNKAVTHHRSTGGMEADVLIEQWKQSAGNWQEMTKGDLL
jgi:hypothetical protein